MAGKTVYAKSAEVPAKAVAEVAQLVARGDSAELVNALTSGRFTVVLGVTRADGKPLTAADLAALAALG